MKKHSFLESKKFVDSTIRYKSFIKNSASFGPIHKKYFDFDQIKFDIKSSVLLKNKKFLKEKKE